MDSRATAHWKATHRRRIWNAIKPFAIHLVFCHLCHIVCVAKVYTSSMETCQTSKLNYVPYRLHHMNNNSLPLERAGRLLVLVICWTMAVLVCLSRTYLQYHTCSQVVVGGIVGSITGTAWFAVTHLLLTPFFPFVVSWYVMIIVSSGQSFRNVLNRHFCFTSQETIGVLIASWHDTYTEYFMVRIFYGTTGSSCSVSQADQHEKPMTSLVLLKLLNHRLK